MKFLIFGSTGFVGSNLVKYLQDQGNEVLGISRSGRQNSISMDITNSQQFSKIEFKPDVVINCASILPTQEKKTVDPLFLSELFNTNVVGGANIANWAVANNIPDIINCSTLVVVKKPWPVPLTEECSEIPEGVHVGYSMSKLSQEQIMKECVRDSNTQLKHVRLSAVYGQGMVSSGIIFNLITSLIENKDLNLTNADINSLDLIHVEDVSKALYAISKIKSNYDVINLGGGEIYIYQLAEKLKAIIGSTSQINNVNSGGVPSNAKIDVNRLKLIIGKVYEDFIPLDSGLKNIVEHFKA